MSSIRPLQFVTTLDGDRTVDENDHEQWFICDVDAAGGDITITVNEALQGVVMHFRKKGAQGNVVFAAGSGVTLNGDTTITAEDGVGHLIYDESEVIASTWGDTA